MKSCSTCSPCISCSLCRPWKLCRPRVDVLRTNQEPYPPKIQLLTWSTGKFLTIWAQTFTVLRRTQKGDWRIWSQWRNEEGSIFYHQWSTLSSSTRPPYNVSISHSDIHDWSVNHIIHLSLSEKWSFLEKKSVWKFNFFFNASEGLLREFWRT